LAQLVLSFLQVTVKTPQNLYTKTNMKTRSLTFGVMAAGALVLVTEARANVVFGSLWEGISDNTPAIPSNLPGGAPNVTFTAPSPINFDSRASGNGYTIGGWLSTGSGTILTGAGEAGNTIDDTFIYITGQVTVNNGQVFTLAHDDGLTLIINGQTVVNAPNPTAPTVTSGTYTGPSGNWDFQLYYDEVKGAPAVLQVDLPFQSPSVPDGGTTFALLGMSLAGLASLARRFRLS
jgi:VPDSG-CTERM motif